MELNLKGCSRGAQAFWGDLKAAVLVLQMLPKPMKNNLSLKLWFLVVLQMVLKRKKNNLSLRL